MICHVATHLGFFWADLKTVLGTAWMLNNQVVDVELQQKVIQEPVHTLDGRNPANQFIGSFLSLFCNWFSHLFHC